MAELEVGTRRKMYCNTCRSETHHELRAVHPREYHEVENEGTDYANLVFWEKFLYRFWTCLGCDTGSLEEAYTNIGMLTPDSQVWDSKLYPKRATRDLPLKRFRQLGSKLAAIYGEVIESYNHDSHILCIVGLRALLEGVCEDKNVTGNNLYEKIDGLDTYLPHNIVESLHSFRFMGNQAAHELAAPTPIELQLAIDVMEDLLNFLYELEYKARRLPRK